MTLHTILATDNLCAADGLILCEFSARITFRWLSAAEDVEFVSVEQVSGLTLPADVLARWAHEWLYIETDHAVRRHIEAEKNRGLRLVSQLHVEAP